MTSSYLSDPIGTIHHVLSNRRFDLFQQLDQQFELASLASSTNLYQPILACDSVEVLEVVQQYFDKIHLQPEAIEYAALHCGYDVNQWLRSHGAQPTQRSMVYAIANPCRTVVELHHVGAPSLVHVSCAMYQLDYDLVQWFSDVYQLCPPVGEQHTLVAGAPY